MGGEREGKGGGGRRRTSEEFVARGAERAAMYGWPFLVLLTMSVSSTPVSESDRGTRFNRVKAQLEDERRMRGARRTFRNSFIVQTPQRRLDSIPIIS